MKLHLGVVDIPYTRYSKRRSDGAKTTGDVAEILEAKYGVMEAFYDNHEVEVVRAFERSAKAALEAVLSGAPPTLDAFAEANAKVKTMFDRFITSREVERLGIPGVPTRAAKAGVSHRFKKKRSGTRRPSFVDTGLYLNSFTSWVTR